MLVEVLAYDDEQHNHIMRSALYGQIFALKGVLHKEVAVYLLVGVSVESHLPHRLHADCQTMICPRPPISLQNMFKVIEVCSGLGCLGVGLEHSGFEVVLRTDISEPMTQLASKIHASPTLCADITNDITMGKIRGKIPYSCSLAAGVSCQPFSKLGDKRQKLDPRSLTLPTVLRMTFLMRQAIVIIECVDEAMKCEWVQQVLSKFHQATGYRVQQGLLHLQNVWPARRSRWWCVISHPMIGDIPWKPLPVVVNSPILSHLLDDFQTCSPEDLQHLELDTYELNHFERAGFLNNELAIHSQMPTSLHSCGNQLSGCPCLCRKYPFSNDRLMNGGLHGLLVRLVGEKRASYATFPRYRHIHPSELALFNGMCPNHPWKDDIKLSLAGLGQLASPLQSCWIGSSIRKHLSLMFRSDPESPSPEVSLSELMAHLLKQRDQVFGPQTGANARAFQIMVDSRKFVMPNMMSTVEVPITPHVTPRNNEQPVSHDSGSPKAFLPDGGPTHRNISLSQGGGNGMSDVEFAKALSKALPRSSEQWMSDQGGVMGFAVQNPQESPPKDFKETAIHCPTHVIEANPDVKDDCPVNAEQDIQNEPIVRKQFQIVLIPVGDTSPIDIAITEGTTPSQLALGESRLNPDFQSIAARSMVGTHLPLYEPLKPGANCSNGRYES